MIASQLTADDASVLDVWDRLLDDDVHYCQSGDAYRRFVDDHYTYAAFVRRVDEICAKRGWT